MARPKMRAQTMYDGSILPVPRAASDSGQVSGFRPAQHIKPQAQGAIRRILNRFLQAFKKPDPSKTTEQGASGAASPSTYQLSLFQQRYERRQKISDCRQMLLDDPRARRSVSMFAMEAVRNGITIVVTDKSGVRQSTGRLLTIASQVQDLVNSNIYSWARMLIAEGDLFIQGICFGSELVDLKRMPAAAMERLSDDTDEFIDASRAFAQVDVLTNEEVATFPQALMFHQRWNHIDGERYGEPEVVAGRRMRRLIELMEEAQAVRRMTRAPQRMLWNIGTDVNPGNKTEVEDFKEANGFVEGRREIFDPTEIARDVFSNGLVKAEVLDSDSGVSDIEDIKYLQNIYASSALPTPPALYNLDAESINRDVLEDQRAEWLKQTQTLTSAVEEVVKWAMDLALLLAGVLPETVDYTIHSSESTIEDPSKIVNRTIQALRSGLITQAHAIQLVSDVLDIEDPAEMARAVVEEQAQKTQLALSGSPDTQSGSGPQQKPLSLGLNQATPQSQGDSRVPFQFNPFNKLPSPQLSNGFSAHQNGNSLAQ